MSLLTALVIFSSASFFAYGFMYFTSSKTKDEFIRYGMEKHGLSVAVLQIIGASGMLVGLISDFILLTSSLGFVLMMFFGIAVRIKIKDPYSAMLPALFFLLLNLYIAIETLKIFAFNS
jgi:hypothetical protein